MGVAHISSLSYIIISPKHVAGLLIVTLMKFNSCRCFFRVLIIKRRWPPELEEKYSLNQIPLFNHRFYGDNGSERQGHSSTSTLLKRGHTCTPALFPLIACGLKTQTYRHTHMSMDTHRHTQRCMHPLPSISVPILFSFFASIAREECNGSYTLKYSAISKYSNKYLNPL